MQINDAAVGRWYGCGYCSAGRNKYQKHVVEEELPKKTIPGKKKTRGRRVPDRLVLADELVVELERDDEELLRAAPGALDFAAARRHIEVQQPPVLRQSVCLGGRDFAPLSQVRCGALNVERSTPPLIDNVFEHDHENRIGLCMVEMVEKRTLAAEQHDDRLCGHGGDQLVQPQLCLRGFEICAPTLDTRCFVALIHSHYLFFSCGSRGYGSFHLSLSSVIPLLECIPLGKSAAK